MSFACIAMLTVQHHTSPCCHKGLSLEHAKILLCYHCTGCSLEELWDLSAVGITFLPDVSLLHNAAQYPSCDAGYIGSAVLVNTTPNTTTVAYYSGITAGSTACFVCDEDSGYELNLIVTERVCQSNGTWSGSPIICGML